MKTTKTIEIEIERHNVTPAQFLAYLRSMQKKHPEMANDFDLNMFSREGWSSNYSNALPTERPCEAERVTDKPYQKQTYIRNHDGSTYNEIIEFQFDDEKTGHSYYYTVQIDVADEDREANTAENVAAIIRRRAEQADRQEVKAEKAEQEANEAERRGYTAQWWIDSKRTEAATLRREAAETRAAIKATQEAHEAAQEAPAAEAEQQPTETENAPQAATQAAKGADEKKEEVRPMSNPNKLYLSNWDYNAALIIEELAAIVENNGGTVKPGTETIIENRALNENMRKAADRLTQLESIEADNPGTNEHRTDAIKRIRADIEKWERIDNTPRTVHHCTWSSAYISFKLGGMYYYYQTDSNPFFDFHYQKTPIDINGTVSRCACLENDPKEWLYDCFFRAEATDADRREAANLIYNMLMKAAPSVIRRDSHRVRVRNQYDGRYHYETVYEKERREAVNF